jgi:hypothetical protein
MAILNGRIIAINCFMGGPFLPDAEIKLPHGITSVLIAACILFASCISGETKPVEASIEAPTAEEAEYVVLVIERPPYITKEVEGIFLTRKKLHLCPCPAKLE